MKNFIIFFRGREGTTPLVSILNNFKQLNIVHRVDYMGYEPFEFANCGPMSAKDLKTCFELIYSNKPLDMVRLNEIYTKTAKKPLEAFDKSKSIGFKNRFSLPRKPLQMVSKYPKSFKYFIFGIQMYRRVRFEQLVIPILKKNHIMTFFAIRQNVLRLALSEYHGDGYGHRGHLQFKLASGEITKDEIPKISVDCDRLEELISKYERHVQRKKALMEKFEHLGIKTYALMYETFCDDKLEFFKVFFRKLNIEVSDKEIETAIRQGSVFKKVHSDNISDFVINHKEVLNRFGDRKITWR
jgi:hypothetical protein